MSVENPYASCVRRATPKAGTVLRSSSSETEAARLTLSGAVQGSQPFRKSRPACGQRRVVMNDLQAAKGLGVFSVALGLTQLMAPNWLGISTGAGMHPKLTRVCGVRELASGIGVLSGRKPATGLWARVAGDVIDIGLLGVALFK